jgi:hypothetical protein
MIKFKCGICGVESAETNLEDTFFEDMDAVFDVSSVMNDESSWCKMMDREYDELKKVGWFHHTDLFWCSACEIKRIQEAKQRVVDVVVNHLKQQI